MKRTIAIALFILSTLGAGVDALAQEHGLKANIPFVFAVGDQVLPAGTYTITSPSHGIVFIRSTDLQFKAMTTAAHENRESGGRSKLVFNKYGDQYFLHQILCPTSVAMNVDIPTSNREKRVRSDEPSLERGEVALLGRR